MHVLIRQRLRRAAACSLCIVALLSTVLAGVPGPSLVKPEAASAAGTGELDEIWSTTWGTSWDDSVLIYPWADGGTAVDGAGNLFLTVQYVKPDKTWADYALVKLDPRGYEVWERPLGSGTAHWTVAADREGNSFVIGSAGAGINLRKYDAGGNLVWTKAVDPRLDMPFISVESSGSVYVAGTSVSGANPDAYVVRYDRDSGDQQWIQQFGSAEYERVFGIAATEGGATIVGETKGTLPGCTASGAFSDLFVARFLDDGQVSWTRQSGSGQSSLMARPGDIDADADGNVCITSAHVPWAYGPNEEIWTLTKYDASGAEAYSQALPEKGAAERFQYSAKLTVDESGNAYVLTRDLVQGPAGARQLEARVLKYDTGGAPLATRQVDGAGSIDALTLAGGAGHVYVVGETRPAGGTTAVHVRKLQGDVDTDGDGLPDTWETNGVKVDGVWADLPAMGADPKRKDIFIEVDWMQGHRPKDAAMEAVVKAFADAPVANPDGSRGITLHIDHGPASVMDPKTGEIWAARSKAGERPHSTPTSWEEFQALKGTDTNFSAERRRVFHYCLFAHSQPGTTSGGLGMLPFDANGRPTDSSDFMITLGGFSGGVGSVLEQACTFMHELGHNLALQHGGNEAKQNYKPNYLSIMNYSFGMGGLLKKVPSGSTYSGGTMDYSRFYDIIPLDEKALVEADGLTSSSGDPRLEDFATIVYRQWVESSGTTRTAGYQTAGPRPIDYDRDPTTTGTVACNITSGPWLGAGDSEETTLTSYDDWANIKLRGGAVGGAAPSAGGPSSSLPDVPDLTPEQNDLIPHPYRVAVAAPDSSRLLPGRSLTHTFTVENNGDNPDTYAVAATSSSGWADLAAVPPTLSLAVGESADIVIPVNVPVEATLWDEDQVELSAVSETAPLIGDSGTVFTQVEPTASQTPEKLPITVKDDVGRPAIFGDKVVYLGLWGGTDIGLYDVATEQERQITVRGTASYRAVGQPDIYGSKIVWVGENGRIGGSGTYDVWLYDLDTSTEQRLTNHGLVAQDSTGAISRATIHGDKVVYKKTYGSSVIACVYDLTSGVEDELTETESYSPWFAKKVCIYGDKIVWDNTPYIFSYDLGSGLIDTVYQSPGGLSNRGIDFKQGRIVWDDSRNGNYDIYLYDFDGDSLRRLTDDTTEQSKPVIYGDRVLYGDMREGSAQTYLCELPSGAEHKVFGASLNRAIYETKLVFEKLEATGKSALYYMDLAPGALAPQTTLTSAPDSPGADGWFGTAPQITLTADRAGVSTFYQWDSTTEGGWSAYTGPIAALEGEHTLNYYSADRAGNAEEVKSATFKVDTTSPTTAISSAPDFSEAFLDTFRVLPLVTLDTAEVGATTYAQWDSTSTAGWMPYGGPVTGQLGEHTLYYYSVDAHGNAEAVQNRPFRVDTSVDLAPPQTAFSFDPATRVVTLSPNESPASTLYRWDTPFPVDDEYFVPLETGEGTYGPETLGSTVYRGGFVAPEGEHTLYFYSTDSAGNAELVNSRVVGGQSENTAPVASADAYTVNQDTVLSVAAPGVLANDTDAEGDPLIALELTQPSHGTVTLSADGSFQYLPAAGYYGPDSFTYKVSDGDLDSDVVGVAITVNRFVKLTPVHRFYNIKNGAHFYTATEAEKESVIKNLSAVYRHEGLGYLIDNENPGNSAPVYRFYNPNKGVHFYTASASEKQSVIANLSHIYTYEGVAFKVSLQPSSMPVWRFYNVKTGVHFYTISPTERDNVVKNLSASFKYEGVGYYIAN